METSTVLVGVGSMTAPLRRVLVREPDPAGLGAWQAFGWRSAPDEDRLLAEHAALRGLLEDLGAEVVTAPGSADGPDAIYAFDPAIVIGGGAIMLRSGKAGRRTEHAGAESALAAAGVPVRARIDAPATVDGGDLLLLDEGTLLVGRGYRTNAAGVASLRAALPDLDVRSFDLPHHHGPEEVLHLLSFISPVAPDLALVYPPLVPVALMELLAERGVALVEVPDAEYDSLGCNVLAVAPRRVVAASGNDETRRRLEAAGVEVHTYAAEELSKGDGGPTCLTCPLLRRS
jgi:N-dimethylarginine dimethylaminohydrolase